MKVLSVVITQKFRPISVSAILDVFYTVNNFSMERDGKPLFEIQLVSDGANKMGKVFDLYDTMPLHQARKSDLILIPAFQNGDYQHYISVNQSYIPWIISQAKNGSEVASFCTGAFLLACTGLLNGKRATTHPDATQKFSTCFPDVILREHEVVTDDTGIYTSGGATSSFHLMLYLIEKYCNREMAIKTAKIFAIDMDRDKQSYFANFSPTTNIADTLVTKAQSIMESKYGEGITIEEVIKELPVSRRNFIRRFKGATGLTPIEYLQRIRVEAAKRLLEQGNDKISSVMMDVGYRDSKGFRQVFSRFAGLTPQAYREKFSALV